MCDLDGTELGRSEIREYGTEEPHAVLKRISTGLNPLLQRHSIGQDSILGICMAMGGRRPVLEAWRLETATDQWESYPVEVDHPRLRASASSVRTTPTAPRARRVLASRRRITGLHRHLHGRRRGRRHPDRGQRLPRILWKCRGDQPHRGRTRRLTVPLRQARMPVHGRDPQALVARIAADPLLAQACGVASDASFRESYQCFSDAVHQGVPAAVELFESAANQLASVILDLVNGLDLNLVTLAGPGIAPPAEEYLSRVEQQLNRFAYLREVHPINARLGADGADAAAIGAASVALHRNLTPHHSAG